MISDNLKNIKAIIGKIAEEFEQKEPILIAVSKKQNISTIKQAIAAGQIDFGENQIKEAGE